MNVNYFLLNGAFKGVKLLLTVIVSSLKIGTGLSIHAFKNAYESYPTMRDRSKSLIFFYYSTSTERLVPNSCEPVDILLFV